MPHLMASTGNLPQHNVAERERKRILDPEGPLIRISSIACSICPFVSLLFMYIPVIDHQNKCFHFDYTPAIALSVLHLVLGFLSIPFILHLIAIIKDDMTQNSLLKKATWVCVVVIWVQAIVSLPQFHFFGVFPIYRTLPDLGSKLMDQFLAVILLWIVRKIRQPITLRLAIICVYGCTLLIHFVGAWWYLSSINSELRCWGKELNIGLLVSINEVTCGNLNQTQVSLLNSSCSFASPIETFNYGIYTAALKSRVIESSTNFSVRWFYCLYWAFCQLSSLGQNLETRTDSEEITFATMISWLSVFTFPLVFGSLQNLHQHNYKEREAKCMKENDSEAWMSRQNVPERLRKRIREYEDYKWKNTWFVEQETLIRNLPKDIRMDLRRHLCWALVTKVPQFTRLMLMDSDFLHALCDRLKPIFYIKNTLILLEGKRVEEMIFIKEGNLKTKAKDTQRPGSYIISNLKDGDFCGEELVTWALNPNSSSDHILPISTKTVETVSNVKAYVLLAEDLKSIASQLHTSYTYRLGDWPRTRAAGKIQKAWSCHRKMRSEQSLSAAEASSQSAPVMAVGTPSPAGSTIHASRFATIELASVCEKRESSNSSAT